MVVVVVTALDTAQQCSDHVEVKRTDTTGRAGQKYFVCTSGERGSPTMVATLNGFRVPTTGQREAHSTHTQGSQGYTSFKGGDCVINGSNLLMSEYRGPRLADQGPEALAWTPFTFNI